MGDSRKCPYHTTDGFSEFQGQGGVLRTGNPKAWGDTYEWNSEGMGGVYGRFANVQFANVLSRFANVIGQFANVL